MMCISFKYTVKQNEFASRTFRVIQEYPHANNKITENADAISIFVLQFWNLILNLIYYFCVHADDTKMNLQTNVKPAFTMQNFGVCIVFTVASKRSSLVIWNCKLDGEFFFFARERKS